MAFERIDALDLPSAVADIVHYVRDPEVIQRTWTKEFFRELFNKIIVT